MHQQIAVKLPNIKFNENQSRVAWVFTYLEMNRERRAEVNTHIFLQLLVVNMPENLSQSTSCLQQDWSPGLPKYETGMQPLHSDVILSFLKWSWLLCVKRSSMKESDVWHQPWCLRKLVGHSVNIAQCGSKKQTHSPRREVFHATSNLVCKRDKIFLGKCLLLLEVCANSRLITRWWSVLSEEVPQVPVWGKFHHNVQWSILRAAAQQVDYVDMFANHLHHLHLWY